MKNPFLISKSLQDYEDQFRNIRKQALDQYQEISAIEEKKAEQLILLKKEVQDIIEKLGKNPTQSGKRLTEALTKISDVFKKYSVFEGQDTDYNNVIRNRMLIENGFQKKKSIRPIYVGADVVAKEESRLKNFKGHKRSPSMWIDPDFTLHHPFVDTGLSPYRQARPLIRDRSRIFMWYEWVPEIAGFYLFEFWTFFRTRYIVDGDPTPFMDWSPPRPYEYWGSASARINAQYIICQDGFINHDETKTIFNPTEPSRLTWGITDDIFIKEEVSRYVSAGDVVTIGVYYTIQVDAQGTNTFATLDFEDPNYIATPIVGVTPR